MIIKPHFKNFRIDLLNIYISIKRIIKRIKLDYFTIFNCLF